MGSDALKNSEKKLGKASTSMRSVRRAPPSEMLTTLQGREVDEKRMLHVRIAFERRCLRLGRLSMFISARHGDENHALFRA